MNSWHDLKSQCDQIARDPIGPIKFDYDALSIVTETGYCYQQSALWNKRRQLVCRVYVEGQELAAMLRNGEARIVKPWRDKAKPYDPAERQPKESEIAFKVRTIKLKPEYQGEAHPLYVAEDYNHPKAKKWTARTHRRNRKLLKCKPPPIRLWQYSGRNSSPES